MRKKVVSDCIALAVICLFPSFKLSTSVYGPGQPKVSAILKDANERKMVYQIFALIYMTEV